VPADPDYMESLARGLSVIRAFGQGRAQLSTADVAAATGLSRAAARRCLHTLSVLGYAAARNGVYELTPAILALGHAYLGSTPIAAIAQPVLERLSAGLQESSSLAVLDGDDIVYVARAATRRILSVGLTVGSHLPAACTSMGRVLLAHADDAVRERFLSTVKLTRHTPRTIADKRALRTELDRVRAQGYAVVDQELELGLRSLAVPVQRHDGLVVAAINVGVQTARVEVKVLVRDFLGPLRDAANEITRALGGTGRQSLHPAEGSRTRKAQNRATPG
jgi:IclR family pca regulon transcriptional regulator